VLRWHLVALAEQTGLLSGIGERCYIDIDSLLRPVYGKVKQGASFGHTKIASKTVLRGDCHRWRRRSVPRRLRHWSLGCGYGPGGQVRRCARRPWSPRRSTPPWPPAGSEPAATNHPGTCRRAVDSQRPTRHGRSHHQSQRPQYRQTPHGRLLAEPEQGVKTVARDAYGFRNPANQRLRTRCATPDESEDTSTPLTSKSRQRPFE